MLQWMYTVSHVIYISVTYSSHIGYGHHFFEMIAWTQNLDQASGVSILHYYTALEWKEHPT